MSKVLPCPFCGGPAETSRGLHNYDMWGIWCPDCKISVCALYPSEHDAIDAWNRRAEPTCNRDALIKLADSMDADASVGAPALPIEIQEYALRIREALES